MFRTIPGNRVSWFRDKFTNPHNSAPKRQNQEHKEAVSNSVRQTTPLGLKVVKIPRAPDFFHSGNFSCPSPLPQSSICQKPGIARISFLQDCGTSQSASSTEDSMVERPPTCLEWASHFKTAYRTYNRDRCLNQGVGCSLPESKHRGRWSPQKELHINSLELLAGSLVVKTFAKGVAKVHILLLMDSVSAVSYINKLGGTNSLVLNSLAYNLWTWCLNNQVSLTAQHIPEITNTQAGWESRVFQDSSDWKLNPQMFAAINKLWGPFGIDLFARCLTKHLPKFVSWKPDPVGHCLRQVQVQQVVEPVIVTPVWPAQAWYLLLLELCVDYPVLLPQDPSVLMRGQEIHPLAHLHLAEWLVSIDHSRQCKFLQRLGKSFCQPGPPILPSLIHQPGTSGIAGVWNTIVIPFCHLSLLF